MMVVDQNQEMFFLCVEIEHSETFDVQGDNTVQVHRPKWFSLFKQIIIRLL